MKNSYDYILSNLVFITRIPIRLKFEYKYDGGNVKFFPLIGIILGLIMLGGTLIAQKIFGNMVASVTSVFTMVLLTGGIHLDGLSDMADGLLSYKDKDTMIEIMKDSRIGAMGVIALIAVLILKTAFVHLMLDKDMYLLLFLYPIFGRIAIVNACYFGKPITKSKLGAGYIGNMNNFEYTVVQLVYILISFIFLFAFFKQSYMIFLPVILTTAFLLVLSKCLVQKVQHQIGGISGDVLGGVCEIGEVLSLPILYLGVRICEKLIS